MTPGNPALKYPDPIIQAALERAVQKCNRRIWVSDVLAEIIDMPLRGPTYTRALPFRDKKYLSFRISKMMKELGYIQETHKIWIVKECVQA